MDGDSEETLGLRLQGQKRVTKLDRNNHVRLTAKYSITKLRWSFGKILKGKLC